MDLKLYQKKFYLNIKKIKKKFKNKFLKIKIIILFFYF